MQRPFPNGHKCPFVCNGFVICNGRGRWSKPTALFWCQNLYRELSQLPLRQLSAQKGPNLFYVAYIADNRRRPLQKEGGRYSYVQAAVAVTGSGRPLQVQLLYRRSLHKQCPEVGFPNPNKDTYCATCRYGVR